MENRKITPFSEEEDRSLPLWKITVDCVFFSTVQFGSQARGIKKTSKGFPGKHIMILNLTAFFVRTEKRLTHFLFPVTVFRFPVVSRVEMKIHQRSLQALLSSPALRCRVRLARLLFTISPKWRAFSQANNYPALSKHKWKIKWTPSPGFSCQEKLSGIV